MSAHDDCTIDRLSIEDDPSHALRDWHEPLDPDRPDDGRVEVSRRSLARLAVAATTVGARFEAEGVQHDPVAWLLAPRNAFDGRPALEACLELRGLERCLALHAGPGLGMDADPAELDRLLSDDDGHGAAGSPRPSGSGPARAPRNDPPRMPRRPMPGTVPATDTGPTLFSFTMQRVEGHEFVKAFMAGVFPSERDFRACVFQRYGAMAALGCGVRRGFDPYEPVAVDLVSEAVGHRIVAAAVGPCGPEGLGLEVVVEQRLRA